MRNLKIVTLCLMTFLSAFSSAETVISPGPVFGTWEVLGSPYLIQGEITIPMDSILTIQPGVDVIFQGYYKFITRGRLEAIGTEGDSILFTAADTSIGWHGIRFIDVAEVSQLSYCIIQWGNACGDPQDNIGGGIYCQNSNYVYSVLIDHCLIRYNRADYCGGTGGEDSPAMMPSNAAVSD